MISCDLLFEEKIGFRNIASKNDKLDSLVFVLFVKFKINFYLFVFHKKLDNYGVLGFWGFGVLGRLGG